MIFGTDFKRLAYRRASRFFYFFGVPPWFLHIKNSKDNKVFRLVVHLSRYICLQHLFVSARKFFNFQDFLWLFPLVCNPKTLPRLSNKYFQATLVTDNTNELFIFEKSVSIEPMQGGNLNLGPRGALKPLKKYTPWAKKCPLDSQFCFWVTLQKFWCGPLALLTHFRSTCK